MHLSYVVSRLRKFFFGASEVISRNELEDLPGEKQPFSATFGSALPGTGVFLDELTSSNSVNENELENVLNPIVDRGTNDIGDNEIEDEDDDGDERSYAQAARTPSLTTAASTQQNAKIEFLRRMVRRAQ